MPEEGICGHPSVFLEADVDTDFEEIFAKTNNLQTAYHLGNRANDVLMFNIKEDPYELVNVYSQNVQVLYSFIYIFQDPQTKVFSAIIRIMDISIVIYLYIDIVPRSAIRIKNYGARSVS